VTLHRYRGPQGSDSEINGRETSSKALSRGKRSGVRSRLAQHAIRLGTPPGALIALPGVLPQNQVISTTNISKTTRTSNGKQYHGARAVAPQGSVTSRRLRQPQDIFPLLVECGIEQPKHQVSSLPFPPPLPAVCLIRDRIAFLLLWRDIIFIVLTNPGNTD